jgi:hypothetical protein
VFADCALVAHFQFPWIVNRRRIVDVNITADPRTEASQQKSPPPETGPWTKPKKGLDEGPKHPANHFAGGIFSGAPILFNVQHVCSSGVLGAHGSTADYADHADFTDQDCQWNECRFEV